MRIASILKLLTLSSLLSLNGCFSDIFWTTTPAAPQSVADQAIDTEDNPGPEPNTEQNDYSIAESTAAIEKAMVTKGTNDYESKDYAAAISELTAYLETYSSGIYVKDAQILLAKSYYRLGSFDLAKDILDKALQLYADDGEADQFYYWRALTLQQLDMNLEARTDFQVVLDKYPTGTYVIPSKYGIAKTYYSEKSFLVAVELFEQYMKEVSSSPKSDNVMYYLARSYQELGDNPSAIEKFNQLKSGYPLSKWIDEASYQLGKIYYFQTNYNAAIDEFIIVITDFPNSNVFDSSLYYVARIMHRKNQFEAARMKYDIIVSSYPDGTYADNANYYRCASYYDEGELSANTALFDTASYELNTFIDKFPLSAYVENAYYYIVRSNLRLGNISVAEGFYTTLVTNFPSSVYLDDAEFYIAKFYYDQAVSATTNNIALYNTAIEKFNLILANSSITGSEDIAQYYLARSFHRLFELTSAQTDFDNALLAYTTLESPEYITSPYLDNAKYYIGKLQYDHNLFDQASVSLDDFTVLFPNSSYLDEAWYYYGRSLQRMNAPNTILARDAFTLLLRDFPASSYADNATYFNAYNYHLEGDCVNELAAMQSFISTYTTSSYVPRAQVHIDDINLGVHVCL
ncbi:MAG: outer membrane protein assembly factor BamD [Gammaproteobacteria bacterium]|nr:outer membrane protein assembly factor BamD [Gammaproteobacteria bacterium]